MTDLGGMLGVGIGAAVTTLAGLVVLALWRAGGKALTALVEISRLPSLVESLLEELRTIAHRVTALEDLLPGELRARVDLTLTKEGSS